MPELAEVAFACGKWNPGIGKFIKEVYANPSSRVYRDLLPKDVVSELTKAKLYFISNSWKANAIQA